MLFRPGSRQKRRAALWLPALLCVAVGSAGCSMIPGGGPAGDGGSVSIVPEGGQVRITSGSKTTSVRSRLALSPGDFVEVGEDDLARLVTEPGTRIQLWGAKVEVISRSAFRLISGRILVNGASPIRIDAGSMSISSARSVFRVDKQLATRVANYSGNLVSVNLPPETLRIPPFRQVVTVQGILPKLVQPLRFSSSDGWDRRLLSEAIDLDARVSNFAEGLEAQLGSAQGLAFFANIASNEFAVDFLRPYLDSRRSDVLIGLLVAMEAHKLRGLPLDLRFDRIFSLWNQGASWGLLAQEFGAGPEALFGQLTKAVARTQIQVIGPGPALVTPALPPRRATVRRLPDPPAPRAAAPNQGSASLPRASDPALLPPPVARAVPTELKTIVDDLYGVVDPVADLPPIL